MEQNEQVEQQAVVPNPLEVRRQQELKAGTLPSQRIRLIHLAMLDHKMELLWNQISREKLKPSCNPQTLALTKEQVAMSLTQDQTLTVAAILRFLDDCFLATVPPISDPEQTEQPSQSSQLPSAEATRV